MHPTETQLVEVYRAANPIEAHTIRLALEDVGIQVEIDGESLQGGEYPLGWSTAPRILVTESQVTEACEVMEQAHSQRTADMASDEKDEVLRWLACGQVMGLASTCKTQNLSELPVSRERKIKRQHQERLAVVYIPQSSMNQVQQNQESTQLQYGLVSHAISLGWPKERVLVIDDDLGVSGATAEGRIGFQRLLGDIALNHVGMILGVEMSRLARSCKDWYQLLELCGLLDTLICDLDGVYDPSNYNDRLLLELKGTMSEAELHVIRQRMWQGALQKARRGEVDQQGSHGIHAQWRHVDS